MFDLEALESVRNSLKFRGAVGMSKNFRQHSYPIDPSRPFTDGKQERLELGLRFWKCE